jgi:hypothetical protein
MFRLFLILLAWSPLVAHAQAPGDRFRIEVVGDITIDADGHVSALVPEAAAPKAIREVLVSRIGHWAFAVPTWQGRAVQIKTQATFILDIVTRSDRKQTMVIRGIGRRISKPQPIVYPNAMHRAKRGGRLDYRAQTGAGGGLQAIELVSPTNPGELASLDAAVRTSMATWVASPIQVDGQPVACMDEFAIDFRPDPTSNAPLASAATPYKAPDRCPLVQISPVYIGTTIF